VRATAESLEATRPRELTPEQQAAIGARSGDVFTEAGAGTGKTRVLVQRYCDAVTDDGVGPDAILAFTFTERAAGELRERIRRELTSRARAAAEAAAHDRAAEIARAARDGERAWITTMHGFCRRLLAAHPVAAQMDPRFRVLDDVEAARLRERAFAAALDEIVEGGGEAVARFAAGFHLPRLGDLVRTAHERLRSQGVDPPRLPDPGAPVRSSRDEEEAESLTPAEAALAADGFAALSSLLESYHRHYEELKAERAGADFQDLELRALSLLRSPGPARAAWGERFEHLMVDEFQDTNGLQLALIDALRGPRTRLFAVGDEFQSIYRFRHADLEVFRRRRRAAKDDPRTETIPLRGNFRSAPQVLAAVNFVGCALLDHFTPLGAGRKVSEPSGPGPAVELLLTDASEDKPGQATGWRAPEIELQPPPSETSPAYVAEARFLARRLQKLAAAGVSRGDMVVLLRAFTHVDAYEEALDRAGLAPYVVGGRGYWSQQQVEDTLRLLGVVANPLDDELLFGALASPACGASPDALWLLRQQARKADGRPLHVWPTIEAREWPDAMSADDVERLERFSRILMRLRDEAPLVALDTLIDRTISAFDYDLALLARPGGVRRMANVRKLMRLAAEYEEHEGRELRGFLGFAEERTLRDDREGMAAVQVEGHDGVRVMTVHAAKGLQFPVVAVADLGRGLGAGSRDGDVVIGRIDGPDADPRAARFGMRLPIAAAESLRLWNLVELCEEERRADVEEACRLFYVAVSRAQDRLILSGISRSPDLEAAEELKPSHSALKLLLPALRDRGWTGGDGDVVLGRAIAIAEAPVTGASPRIRVRTQAPTAERAAELCRRVPADGEAPGDGQASLFDPRAPLLARLKPAAPVGYLSYSALAAYSGCHYRFYVERVVGMDGHSIAAPPDPAADGEASGYDELPAPMNGSRERALGIGNAVHALLEASARRSWAPPGEEELERILRREGLGADDDARDRVRALVAGWLGSKLRTELDESEALLRPEVPFVLGLGGTVVRGKIDLLAETANGLLVIDYKTNELRGVDPADLAGTYSTQRDVYALAAQGARRGGGAAVRAAYCFLESPDRPAVEVYEEEGLAVARDRLEQLVAGIQRGDFTRTESPHAALCYGCPAAARLCGNPAWRPQWASSSAS
jgi:ATP-dependent helicase/nuclease subunit A